MTEEEKDTVKSQDGGETIAGNEETTEKATEETTEAPAEETAEGKKDKKKEKAKTELDIAKEKIAELEDAKLRQIAEFQNYRNRTEKEKSQAYDMGVRGTIEKLLPVVDNFERGLAALSEEEKSGAFADGMNKIYKQLMTELTNMGVTPIDAAGKPFDPNLHNAVMQVENPELESGTVAAELLKGYTYHDTVVRHSMVSVVS